MKEVMSLAAEFVTVIVTVFVTMICAGVSFIYGLLLLDAQAPLYIAIAFFALAVFLLFSGITLIFWTSYR